MKSSRATATCRARSRVHVVVACSGLWLLTACAELKEQSSRTPTRADGTYCSGIGVGPRRILTCTPERIPPPAVEAEAKRFESASDQLTLYVLRWGDAAGQVRMTIDDRASAITVPNSVVRVRLPAGTHRLTASWMKSEAVIEVTGSVGETRFVDIEGSPWAWGLSYRVGLADPLEARKRAKRLRLVADLKL